MVGPPVPKWQRRFDANTVYTLVGQHTHGAIENHEHPYDIAHYGPEFVSTAESVSRFALACMHLASVICTLAVERADLQT
jgi:hypothetical protein